MAPSNRPSSSSGEKKGKQGTLFSFFSKKPPRTSATNAPAAAAPVATQSPSPNDTVAAAKPSVAASAPTKPQMWRQVSVGSRIEVYFPRDKAYFAATVTGHRNANSSVFTLKYDIDGEVERNDLSTENFRILEDGAAKPEASKKRRIQEDSEDEFELEDTASEAGDGEESVYEQDEDDEDEDDDQWMVTDDELDTPKAPKQKKKTPRFRVTQVQSSASKPPPAKKLKTTPIRPQASSTQTASKPKVTPSSNGLMSPPPTMKARNPLPYVQGAVNPAGSHLHNHLKFLQNPRDSQGRTRDDPNYDPHTLRVDFREMERLGQKVTPANRQWWELKAQYFDTVLLFKTGKFYELYHMDADVGVNVLDFIYMKGHIAHSGFPEVSYGIMAERLVKAGYKVARVEQTETPDMLKERKKKKKGSSGKTPQVVNREVCSILTRGTRTFCYLDDTSDLSSIETNPSSSVGPLLAIREVLMPSSAMTSDPSDDNTVEPVCEYGVTIVDAVRATVTIGQFADDVLRSRMNTLLAAFEPSEVLVEGGENGASPVLQSLLQSVQSTGRQSMSVERIQRTEQFPKSSALDLDARRQLERKSASVHPWDVKETIGELHRRGYYPRASRQQQDDDNTSRWPKVLQAAVEGNAELALSSFGAVLFYLQRNLIDQDILGMGIVRAYIPPSSAGTTKASSIPVITTMVTQQERNEDGVELSQSAAASSEVAAIPAVEFESDESILQEQEINHMALDGTTLQNLEVLFNSQTYKEEGSLWSKINFTKTPHGCRLLRAWLLRPLFRKEDIERRCDAVEELVSGAAAVGMEEARRELAQCGDIERLLSRVHSMGGSASLSEDNAARFHPNERAVLYEAATHTKRMVGDFSKVLKDLQAVSRIPEKFAGVGISSPLLQKLVNFIDDGGCFPDMAPELDWFFDNFDADRAAQGQFEPARGVDEAFDEACDTIEQIEGELGDYKDEMCSHELHPTHTARSKWKYINTKVDSKDKYLIELPASIRVPEDFIVKGKRGKGDKQVNKYRTPVVEQLVQQLEHALDVQREGKARGLQLIYSKFDSKRHLWAAAAQATALLDALGSLAQASSRVGFTRPTIVDCPPNGKPSIKVIQGRHPCVDTTHNGGEFIPNDLELGSSERVLLLSGPNMGGKSTLLRQTCLISILAQIGCFVPASECALTPIDRIYTRLGASDRILQGQSTFFVELAETACALRGATRRSLTIMDELGRGTSTFDGTSIASAAVKHLVERNRCLTLFATHYHSVLDEWMEEPSVRLGHMECLVEESDPLADDNDDDEEHDSSDHNITFLYTLGRGACPKSFGINVARLAGLPEEVLAKAKSLSASFEAEMNGSDVAASTYTERIKEAIANGDFEHAEELWRELQ